MPSVYFIFQLHLLIWNRFILILLQPPVSKIMSRHPLSRGRLSSDTATATATATAAALLLVGFLAAVASIIVSLCITRKQSKGKKASSSSTLTSIKTAKIMLTKEKEEEEDAVVGRALTVSEGESTREEALWKKSIIMGERCKPLVFSGQIFYDSEGNHLPS